MSNAPFSLRLPPATRQRLDAEAQRLDRPASQVAERAIVRYLDAQETLRRQIDEAATQANAGVFISEAALHDWMETWSGAEETAIPEPDISPARG
jgi:predicted transcriptional regulator